MAACWTASTPSSSPPRLSSCVHASSPTFTEAVLEIPVMHITLGAMVSWMHSAGLTLVSFAVLISVIVFFHELGHLVVGKWLGVKAVRFSIGFGPKLFGFQSGETEYRVSLLRPRGWGAVTRGNPLEQLPPQDHGRGFLEQPPREKAAIALAGPPANLLLPR